MRRRVGFLLVVSPFALIILGVILLAIAPDNSEEISREIRLFPDSPLADLGVMLVSLGGIVILPCIIGVIVLLKGKNRR